MHSSPKEPGGGERASLPRDHENWNWSTSRVGVVAKYSSSSSSSLSKAMSPKASGGVCRGARQRKALP